MKIVDIDIDTIRYLEFLHFELNGYKDVLFKLLYRPKNIGYEFDINIDIINHYIDRYIKINTEVETIKKCLINTYVQKDDLVNNFTFDFVECCLKYDMEVI